METDRRRLLESTERLARLYPYRICGRVNQVVGLVVEGRGPLSSVGDSALIYPLDESAPIRAEVVGFRDGKTMLMPLGDLRGIGIGSRILSKKQTVSAAVGENILGRVIDGLGNPIDGKGPLNCRESVPIHQNTANPMKKRRITEPLDLGVRSINGLLTCGRGQRMGIFAGSGVGKSVLLGMVARHTEAKVNVIGLIGERGREVREFIEKDLGDGISHSVVVVATSDQPPLIRVRAAFLTIALAEYFRNAGKRRAASHGFFDAIRHGAKRGRPCHRGAADDEGVSAERLFSACEDPRKGGQRGRGGRHDRHLYSARGRGRS